MITVCYVKAEIMVICCNQIKAHVHFSPEPFNHESFSSDCHGNLGLGDLCVSQDLIMLWGPKSASHRNITGASLPYIRRTARPQNLSQIKTCFKIVRFRQVAVLIRYNKKWYNNTIIRNYGYKKCVLQAPGNAGNFQCHFTDVTVRQNIEAVMK